MTTTELIALLKKYEFGGATGRSREVFIGIGETIYKTDIDIESISTGDGLFTELFLDLRGSEDYTELKREFLRMASYIDVLLECSEEQKETLIGFISRLAEFMPWTEED